MGTLERSPGTSCAGLTIRSFPRQGCREDNPPREALAAQHNNQFGSLANTKQEPWKLPLPEYIEELYFEHFKKNRPENVRPSDQLVSDDNRKKAERKAQKQMQPPAEDPLQS